jgi:hypothetical protein
VPPDATHCPACGDGLAQRESIDDLAIPGVTTMDPTLQAYADQPLRNPLALPMKVDPIGGAFNLAGWLSSQPWLRPMAPLPTRPSIRGPLGRRATPPSTRSSG